ncbi:MAG: MFS transporter [Solirubrobacteraceae bacterium]
MARFAPALQVRDFRLWFVASFGMSFALQMVDVIIGWSVYSHHQSALDLGWIGLAEFIPLFVLALPAGHVADRFPRRYVLAVATVLGIGVALALTAITAAGVHATLPYFALALGAGTTMAIGTPASRAMPPTLVPRELIPNAMTLRSFSGQGAAVIGPALGGLVYGASPTAVYLIAAAGLACATVAALSIGPGLGAEAAAAARRQAASVRSVLEGLSFLGRTPIVLGAILLDLFAVLFGGAVALLPIFASHYLHVGATGLGVLRATPAVGALLGAVLLIRRPIMRHAGRLLLSVVAGFGACMIVFGLSRSFELSLVALLVSGFLDMFSMNIRSTTSALATPDAVRGRVTAVETVFISASNQLGAFESGLAASLAGTIPAVVGGGCITIAIAIGWIRLFPALGGVDQMNELEPVIPEAPTLILADGAN